MKQFPAVVLTGPRRAGKTFLLKHLFPQATYVQLEDPDTLLAVKEDPRSFLAGLTLPVVIDEVQKVPELFAYVRSLRSCRLTIVTQGSDWLRPPNSISLIRGWFAIFSESVRRPH